MNQKAEQIIEVASRLFSEKGYKATSLRDIGSHATLHKSSLFNYFANKEEILMAVMDKSLNKHMNILNEIANDNRLGGIWNSDIRIKRETVLPKKIPRARIRSFQQTPSPDKVCFVYLA